MPRKDKPISMLSGMGSFGFVVCGSACLLALPASSEQRFIEHRNSKLVRLCMQLFALRVSEGAGLAFYRVAQLTVRKEGLVT